MKSCVGRILRFLGYNLSCLPSLVLQGSRKFVRRQLPLVYDLMEC